MEVSYALAAMDDCSQLAYAGVVMVSESVCRGREAAKINLFKSNAVCDAI